MGTVTIGGKSFEIYGTKAAATTYMTGRLGADAWNSASGANRDRALVSGTRWIDRQNWIDQKTAPSQPLEFPRTGLNDKDGNSVDSATVPTIVEEANYEIALVLLDDPTKQDSSSSGSNTKKVKAGSASVEFFRLTEGTKFPTVVQNMIGLWLEGIVPTGAAVFGADACSTFEDVDQWGRDKGFP